MNHTFQIGCRGFLIMRLQNALGITADGIYGQQTETSVAHLQDRIANASSPAYDSMSAMPHALPASPAALSPRGHAGPCEIQSLGLTWPSSFERAMQLVCGFEGTGFGDCNRRDIDGAGLTMGIAGFTTAHGEVQELIARYVSLKPDCLGVLPDAVQTKLLGLLSQRDQPAAHWRRLMYGADGCVFSHWGEAFARWGRCPQMQALQLEMAHERFWKPAINAAESLGFSSIRAKTFFLDVAVQNGGWRRSHLVLAKRMIDWMSDNEARALAVAARAVAASSKEAWRNDVLSRKMAIATGRGIVHGRMWELDHFAV